MGGGDKGAAVGFLGAGCRRRGATKVYTGRSNVRLVLALRCEDPCCCAKDRGDEKSNEGCPAARVSLCVFEVVQRIRTRLPWC